MIQKKKVYTKEESFSQNIGKRIREERLRLNLTQEKLAEDVNLSMAYIGQQSYIGQSDYCCQTAWSNHRLLAFRLYYTKGG